MLQNSVVLMNRSDFVLLDSLDSGKSSFSRLNDDIGNGKVLQKAIHEDPPSINHTLNSPTSPKSLKTFSSQKCSKILKKSGKTFQLQTSLSINESFQDPVLDSRFNLADLSAIEYKSNFVSNSPENTNVNNSFVTENEMVVLGEEGIDMESLKEVTIQFLNGIIRNIQRIPNNILADNFSIVWSVLRNCIEKSEVQNTLSQYVLFLFRENLLMNPSFSSFLQSAHGFSLLKEKFEAMKRTDLGPNLGVYGVRLDLDLMKGSLREESISFLFKVKNFEEKQKIMSLLMNSAK